MNEERQPTEEELRAALEEQMRNITVQDVILQSVVSLLNLTGRRLTGDERDLPQARLGIDAVRALAPLCPDEQAGPVREALSQLQMTFAREARGGATPGSEGEGKAPEPPPAGGADEEAAERAKARAKIWTPPGT